MPPPRTAYSPAPPDTGDLDEFLLAAGMDPGEYAGPSPDALAAMAEDPAARAHRPAAFDPSDSSGADVSPPVGPLERVEMNATSPTRPGEAPSRPMPAGWEPAIDPDVAALLAAARDETPRAPVDEAATMRALMGEGAFDPEGTAALLAAASPDGPVVDLPARRPTAPPRAGTRRPGTAAPSTPTGETDLGAGFVDAMTDRPRDAAPLIDEARETGLDRSLGFVDDRRRLDLDRARASAVGYANERDALAGAEVARADNERDRRDAMAAARQRYSAALESARANTLDPEGWYHDRGVAGTIGSAIMIGLGSLGSALTGGANQALSIINDSIARDLEAQNSAIDNGWRGADAEAGLLDVLASEFDSREAATEAARAAMLEDVAAQIAEASAGLDGTEAGIAAAEMRDQVLGQAQAAAAAAEGAAFDDEIRRRQALATLTSAEATAARDMRRAGGGGAAAVNPLTDAEMNAYNRAYDSNGGDADLAARTAGVDPTLIPATGRFAEATADNNASNVAALSGALDALESLIPGGVRTGGEGSEYATDDIPGVGWTGSLPEFMLTDEGRDLRVEIENTVELLGRIHSGGAITDDEWPRFVATLRGAGTDRALRAGIERIRREIRARTERTREGRTASSVNADVDALVGFEATE